MYRVAGPSNPKKPHIWTSSSPEDSLPGEYQDFNNAWKQFLWEANMTFMMDFPIGLYKDDKLLAEAFEHPNYRDPDWDEFDRYRIRVTGAMPSKFRAKIIEEMKSGIRHMRSF